MFTKNIFKDKDTVADLVGNILEADYKVKKEELKGNQHKIDMNKNNKIDAHDFKLLRSKGTQKEEVESVAEGSDHDDDDYSTASFEKWKKQKEYEKEYDKKKPAKPIVPDNKNKKKGVAEGSNSSPFDQMANLKSKSNKELDGLVHFWQRTLEKNPNHKVANDQLHLTKMIRAERIGKKGAQDQKVKKYHGLKEQDMGEEVEQIDELSSGTIDRYRKKLGTTLDTKPAYTTAAVAAQKEKNAPIRAKIHNALMKQHQAIRRERGMSEGVAEEVEQIDELNKDTLYSYNKKAGADVEKKDKSLGQLIRKGDSVGANKTARQLNNRLAGQERAEKRLNKEEVEQIDELKKSTLKSYTKKADAEVSDIKKKQAEHPRGHISGSDADKKLNRQIGINQATKRIVKKDLTGVAEEVEQIDERTLTPGETSEKERIVKGMKKSLAGFKQRYGDRAKSVMYATATKAAKKD